jgi:hypothetical protein
MSRGPPTASGFVRLWPLARRRSRRATCQSFGHGVSTSGEPTLGRHNERRLIGEVTAPGRGASGRHPAGDTLGEGTNAVYDRGSLGRIERPGSILRSALLLARAQGEGREEDAGHIDLRRVRDIGLGAGGLLSGACCRQGLSV